MKKNNQERKGFGPADFSPPANPKVVNGFVKAVMAATKQIRYRAAYMDHELRKSSGQLSFMPMVNHPTERIALKSGELAVTRSLHPNPEKQFLNTVILMRGTQYGVLILFGRESAYVKNGEKFDGPLPTLHATTAFYAAAQRFFKRRGIKYIPQAASEDLLNWIFSDTFDADLAEQVKIDRAAEAKLSRDHHAATGQVKTFEGHYVGDGLARKPDRIHAKKAEAPAKPTKPVTRNRDYKGPHPAQAAA